MRVLANVSVALRVAGKLYSVMQDRIATMLRPIMLYLLIGASKQSPVMWLDFAI